MLLGGYDSLVIVFPLVHYQFWTISLKLYALKPPAASFEETESLFICQSISILAGLTYAHMSFGFEFDILQLRVHQEWILSAIIVPD